MYGNVRDILYPGTLVFRMKRFRFIFGAGDFAAFLTAGEDLPVFFAPVTLLDAVFFAETVFFPAAFLVEPDFFTVVAFLAIEFLPYNMK